MAIKPRKSWREKVDNGKSAKVLPGPAKLAGQRMLVSCPSDVESLIREIPAGRVITSAQLRERLARDAGADFACPTSTGIFLWLIANAAEEERPLKGNSVTPYWRVVKPTGELNPKYPGGVEAHARSLESEGVRVEGNRVMDFDRVKAML